MYNWLSIQQLDNHAFMEQIMNIIMHYNEDNFSEFEWYEGFAVIRFYADWCAPCVQNFPVFEQAANAFAHSDPAIKFGKVNIDQSPIVSLRYNVYGLPTTLIFHQGQIIKRIAGVKSLTEITQIIQQSISP